MSYRERESLSPQLPSLAEAVAGCLSNAHTILENGGINTYNYPTLPIRPLGERSDGSGGFRTQLDEEISSRWGEIYQFTYPDDLYSVRVSPVVAPHTVPAGEGNEPTHLACWWFGKEGERLDMLALSRLAPHKRRPIIAKIAEGISASIRHLQDEFNISSEELPHEVKVNGVTGHARREEREKGESPARGAQSNPHGHINISHINMGETREAKRRVLEFEESPVTAREMLKQIDPVSEAILRRWEVIVRPIIRRYRRGQDKDFDFDVNFDHKVDRGKQTGPEVRFSDLVILKFSEEGISLADALDITADLYSDQWFGGLYERLWEIYENYWKTDTENKVSVISSSADELINFLIGGEAGSENDALLIKENLPFLLRDMLLIPPSYGQLARWKADPSVSDQTRKKLNIKLDQYRKLDQVINHQADDSKRAKYKQQVRKRKMYDLKDDEAEEFLLYWSDLVKDPQGTYNSQPGWQTSEFLFSEYLSTSYMFIYEMDKKGSIWVKGITLSPKFATTKGGAEDLQGARLERPRGQ